MTHLQRMLSWSVGDVHARRIVWLIRLYCRLFRVSEGLKQNLENLR